MIAKQCNARLPDEETRCTNRIRSVDPSSRFCRAHARECGRSVEEYKDAASRVAVWQRRALKTQFQVQALRTLEQVDDAIEDMQRLVEALQDEAGQREVHSRRFFWDDDDPSNGHLIWLDGLVKKKRSCAKLLALLQERRYFLEQVARQHRNQVMEATPRELLYPIQAARPMPCDDLEVVIKLAIIAYFILYVLVTVASALGFRFLELEEFPTTSHVL